MHTEHTHSHTHDHAHEAHEGGHCHSHDGLGCASELTSDRFDRRILWLVIALNGIMFGVEIFAGLEAHSLSLLADAMDFLGDTASYSIALYVMNKTVRWRAGAALLKGSVMLCFGLWVLTMAIMAMLGLHAPDPITMGTIGVIAFVVNVISALLVYRFSKGDSNLRSVWICSRNDALANVAVVIAASGVFTLNQGWPDIAVALIIAGLALFGSFQVITHALRDLKQR